MSGRGEERQEAARMRGTLRGIMGSGMAASEKKIRAGMKRGPALAVPVVVRECVYIAGERPYGDHPFCGARCRCGPDGFPDSPYCEHHHGICYLPRPAKKPRAVDLRDDGRPFR